MARVLIIGCGCRGRALGRDLIVDGHAVRGTTRDPARARELEAEGIEPWIADPERIATIASALDRVAIMVVLLGSATGPAEALHGTRLEMLLLRTIDTAVRGVVYEAAGTVDQAVLDAGAAIVRSACERSRIPVAVIDAAPGAARAAIDGLLR